jgi:hypothetical protein
MILLNSPYGHPSRIELGRYANGNIAIMLVAHVTQANPDAELFDGEPILTASINTIDLPDDRVAIKTYSENEGIVSLLLNANVIEGSPIQQVKSGFVTIPVYKLGAALLAEIAELDAVI